MLVSFFRARGHVDPRSYSSIAHQIADEGYLVIIPKMLFNLAVINKRAAVKIINEYTEIDNWVIGGHSLGGVMAASLVFDELHSRTFRACPAHCPGCQ